MKSPKDSSKRWSCPLDLSDFSGAFPIVREVRELFQKRCSEETEVLQENFWAEIIYERLISGRYDTPFEFPGALPYRRRMNLGFLPYLPAAKRVSC